MNSWVKHVESEKRELDGKILVLKDLLANSFVVALIEPEEVDRLGHQLTYMELYRDVLRKRIDAGNK